MGEKNPFVPVHVQCEVFPLVPDGGEIRIIRYKEKGIAPVLVYHVSQAQIEALLEWYERRRKMFSPWADRKREQQRRDLLASAPVPVQAPGESLYDRLVRRRKAAGG
ncbi:MAG: hypothetical protein ACPL5F_01835 [Moorellaceae bacterium]